MTIFVDASCGPCSKGKAIGVGFVIRAEGRRLYYGAVLIKNDQIRNPEQQAVDYVRRIMGDDCLVYNDQRGIKRATYMERHGDLLMRSAHFLARMSNLTIKSNSRARRAWSKVEDEGDCFTVKKSKAATRTW